MLDPYTSMHFTSENAQLYDICLSVCLSQTQDHLDVCVADGATTTLTFRLVDARLAEVLVAMWHKCDTCIALCYESYLAVEMILGMGFPFPLGIAQWESHGNGNWLQNWEWEWEGMGIDHVRMGGNGNVKSHSGSSPPSSRSCRWLT